MILLRKHPHLYEINSIVWLDALSRREKRRISLSAVPKNEWSTLRAQGMDIIWLMGVWERSPESRRSALSMNALLEESRFLLDNYSPEDICGSPYAVHRYVAEPLLGSSRELLLLKETLEDEGLALILDFVPNHTARDHPWVTQRPEYYVQGERNASGRCMEGFFSPENTLGGPCIAHGRDPYFPPWTDTAQINYSVPAAVNAMIDTLTRIAPYCHGVRCDMAMLVLRRIFQKTWAPYLEGTTYTEEFWPLATERLKGSVDPFLWIAEAYWGTEGELLEHGFNYVYDKAFYDLMMHGDVEGLKRHLSASVGYQEKMARFLENHDEGRAMVRLGPEKTRSAMVIHGTLPGLRFWHQGQFEGRRIRIPVQLRRGPTEIPENELISFSESLLKELDHPVFHDGRWELCETSGWNDNQSHRSLLAWCWRLGEERRLIVVNFCSSASQGYVRLPVGWLPEGEEYTCRDPLKTESFKGSLKDVRARGLYVDLGGWDFHFFVW